MSTYDYSDLTRNFRTSITVCTCEGCEADTEPCWLFKRVDSGGYASFKLKGRSVVGHRYAYEQLVGQISPNHDIDHLCDRHHSCVNPFHMEPVSPEENARRANDRRWHGTDIEAERRDQRRESSTTQEEPNG